MNKLLWASLCLLVACATRQAPVANPGTPTVRYDMDPIAIEAKRGEGGVTIESYDAEELFEQAGSALSQKRYDDAVRLYDKLMGSFSDSGGRCYWR